MAHDEPAVRHALKEAREQAGEVGLRREIVRAIECRIESNAERLRLRAHADAEQIEKQAFDVGHWLSRARTPALPYPGVRRLLFDRLQEGIAHDRKHMHVLMPIEIIGRAAENLAECVDLRG